MTALATIQVIERLLRSMHPDADETTLHTLATVAAEAYLEHVDDVPARDRDALLRGLVEEVAEDL